MDLKLSSLKRNSESHAFTLLELMIVIGIILILAGIAAENFLAAQVRAKVARIKTDFRTLELGIEAYHADQNQYPRMADMSYYRDRDFDMIDGVPVVGVMSRVLSTPVAYVSNAYLQDPFTKNNLKIPLDERLYTYHVLPIYKTIEPNSLFWPAAAEYYGDWRLISSGPDQLFGHGFTNSTQLPYDPTNGVVSFGNIITSQRKVDGLPGPRLLGDH